MEFTLKLFLLFSMICISCNYDHIENMSDSAYNVDVIIQREKLDLPGFRMGDSDHILDDDAGILTILYGICGSDMSIFSIATDRNRFKFASSDMELQFTRTKLDSNLRIIPTNIFISIKKIESKYKAFFIIWEPIDKLNTNSYKNTAWIDEPCQNITTNLNQSDINRISNSNVLTVKNVESDTIYINDNISRYNLEYFNYIKFKNVNIGSYYPIQRQSIFYLKHK